MADPLKSPAYPVQSPTPRAVLRWHAGWAAGIILAALALSFAGRVGLLSAVRALGAGVVPAIGALVLSRRDSPAGRDLLVCLWALAGAVACGLTGGVSGPLAIWCLTPMMAAVVLGGRRRLALGATLSLLAAALVALAQADGRIGPAAPDLVGLGLGLIGVASVAIGVAAAPRGTPARRAPWERVDAPADFDPVSLGLLNEQPHLIVVLDPAGRVEAAFGDPSGSLPSAGRLRDAGDLAALVETGERALVEAALAEALADGHGAATVRLAGAEPVWMAITLRRRSPTRLVGVLRDATAEHLRAVGLERARADADALNLGKSRFLANMSHELRTPLNAIMGFSDIMRQKIFGPLPTRYGEYADLIHDAGTHLLDLINDVLDMSKIEAARYELSREQLDAREPVQAALRLMRLQADDVGVQLRGILPANPLEIDADRRALKQITLNLVSNALKFTPQGGLVTVTLQGVAGAAELSVADTGIGIAAEDLHRLGRPFEQAGDAVQQGRGTGLGLSLVRAFAELHGGDMVIESRLGEGTAVTVRLPGQAETAPLVEGAAVVSP